METVNLERLREATMDDEEFMVELIDIFLDDAPGQLQALRASVAAGECEQVATAAHRLKGASGNIGAESLSALCKSLEEKSRASRIGELPATFGRLDEEYGRVEDKLRALLAELK